MTVWSASDSDFCIPIEIFIINSARAYSIDPRSRRFLSFPCHLILDESIFHGGIRGSHLKRQRIEAL